MSSIALKLSIDGLTKPASDDIVPVASKEFIPIGSPKELYYVPTRAREKTLQLLHNRAVAADGSIQPLQIAVHDEDQVVEIFAGSKTQPGQRLRLIHLAVADEGPHLSIGGRRQTAILRVTHKPGLIDCSHRAKAHGACRKLPEVRHEPGMRIGRKPLAANLAAKV